MEANSTQSHTYFVILSRVFLTAHFDNNANEGFNDKHTGFRILVVNVFIINEQNVGMYQFSN